MEKDLKKLINDRMADLRSIKKDQAELEDLADKVRVRPCVDLQDYKSSEPLNSEFWQKCEDTKEAMKDVKKRHAKLLKEAKRTKYAFNMDKFYHIKDMVKAFKSFLPGEQKEASREKHKSSKRKESREDPCEDEEETLCDDDAGSTY